MRIEIDKYAEHQIYLRNDGSFVWITSVDPITKFKQNETDRRCIYFTGRVKQKSDEFNDDLFVVENDTINSIITFDISKSNSCTLHELRTRESLFLGTLTKDKIAQYAKRM